MNIEFVAIDEKKIPFEIDDELNLVKFSVEHSGQIAVTVRYSAVLTDTMMGIYPSYYELDGQKNKLLGHNLRLTLHGKPFHV
ncbi:hypothetical protein GCM10025879_06790 [Leuconostoc litchii]|nr:hypothetical protein GCM10025879_06790 [Leuconostoc litchii]